MTVYFRPHGDITKAPTPRSILDNELIEFIAQKTGLDISIDATVDFEDWTEPMTMFAEALYAGLETVILPRTDLRRAVMNPIATIPGKACRDMLIGRQLERDPLYFENFDFGWPKRNGDIANHYAELETFHRHAGRKTALADMPGDREAAGDRTCVFAAGLNSTALGDAMVSLAPGEIMVKQVYPAKILPLLSYDMMKGATADDATDMFFSDVGFHFARFEGDPAALLVQEKIEMLRETRFFIMNGKPVTAAACIEAHTPSDIITEGRTWRGREDLLLLPEWELSRNSGQMDTRPLREREADRDAMWAFAESVAEEITREAPKLDCFVLDIAQDPQGNFLVIEINPIAQSGLYAIDARALFTAIAAYAEAAPAQKVKDWDRAQFENMPVVAGEAAQPRPTFADIFDEDLEDEDFSDAVALNFDET